MILRRKQWDAIADHLEQLEQNGFEVVDVVLVDHGQSGGSRLAAFMAADASVLTSIRVSDEGQVTAL